MAFPKEARILRTAEFRNVYDHGVRVPGPLFTAFCLVREDTGSGSRVGLTVSRKMGGAVARNRIKRRLREAFRLHRNRFERAWDVVLNPRRSILDAEFAAIERSLQQVIQRCNSL